MDGDGMRGASERAFTSRIYVHLQDILWVMPHNEMYFRWMVKYYLMEGK